MPPRSRLRLDPLVVQHHLGPEALAGEQHLRQEGGQRADGAENGGAEQPEQHLPGDAGLQRAEEQRQHRGAGRRAADGGQKHRDIERMRPAAQMPEPDAHHWIVAGHGAQFGGEIADLIGDARQPRGEDAEQAGDGAEQKDRRQRGLDDMDHALQVGSRQVHRMGPFGRGSGVGGTRRMPNTARRPSVPDGDEPHMTLPACIAPAATGRIASLP